SSMEDAALAVLLPLVSEPAAGGAEKIMPVNGAAAFKRKWDVMKGSQNNLMPDASLKYAEVTICGPTTQALSSGSGEVDFDDPALGGAADWQKSESTKLRVQVTFNYRMAIPFANMVIHRAARDQDLPYVLRMVNTPGGASYVPLVEKANQYTQIAKDKKIYIMPIRATYTMRMQSAIFVNQAPIPSDNLCIFPFHQ
ncbi:MAG: pilus assembly protein, partial [Myxococcaceae bacterium]